jgi:hypothetical protein
MGYLIDGQAENGLVEVENLILTLLYDDPIRCDHCALRFVGFSGVRIPWGVLWGGPDQVRFNRDLLLQPLAYSSGLRCDTVQSRVVRLGLNLERALDRHRPGPQLRRVVLPRLWAAFYHCDAASVTGDGPELADLVRRQKRPASEQMAAFRREHGNLVLYPLPWVSNCWRPSAKIYAELEHFPRQQVFSLRSPDDLAGYQAAAQFDFRSGHSLYDRRCAGSAFASA